MNAPRSSWLMFCLCLTLGQRDSSASTSPADESRYHERHEMRALTEVASRVESMMSLAPQTHSRAWVPAEKCHQGKTHLFISAQIGLEAISGPQAKLSKAWSVLAALAAAKYSPASPVEIHVLALSGPPSLNPTTSYYTVDMTVVRKMHRQLQYNEINMEGAWQMLSSNWQKVPRNDTTSDS